MNRPMNRQERRAAEREQPRHAIAKPYETLNLGEKVKAHRAVLSLHDQRLKQQGEQLEQILRVLRLRFPADFEQKTPSGLSLPPGYTGPKAE